MPEAKKGPSPAVAAILSRLEVRNMREPFWAKAEIATLIDAFNKGQSMEQARARLGTFGAEVLAALAECPACANPPSIHDDAHCQTCGEWRS